MRSVICVHERYDGIWPFTADHWHQRWEDEGGCELYRTEAADAHPPSLVPNPESVQRLVLLGMPTGKSDLEPFTGLEECYVSGSYGDDAGDGVDLIKEKGVTVLHPRGDVQWGQTVAEYAMGMTIAALRRIPMTYNAMIAGHETWNYSTKPGKPGKPGQRGQQFGDDTDFLSGTIQGKRVRVIGVGNIGGRYAQWCQMMGADVAVWDPFAPDASFDLAGVTRCWGLDELVSDSDIFAPMVPLTDGTRGLVTAEHIRALPDRSLVLQMTRAKVCDTEALYKRVLDNELFLSADVFDEEPVPLDSPLLGRANVIHTPHNAGRTIDANHARADDGIARFRQR
jgi:phosphoglycerate dehydrogenase-like enzyme